MGSKGSCPEGPQVHPAFSGNPEDLEARQRRLQFHLDPWDFHPQNRPEHSAPRCPGSGCRSSRPFHLPHSPHTRNLDALGSPRRGRCHSRSTWGGDNTGDGPGGWKESMSLNVSKHLPDGRTLSRPRRWEVRLGPCRASAAEDPAGSLPGGRASPHPGEKPLPRPRVTSGPRHPSAAITPAVSGFTPTSLESNSATPPQNRCPHPLDSMQPIPSSPG